MKAKALLVMALTAVIATAAHSQLLWKVADNNTGKTSYVFGTHHFAPLSLLDSIKGLDAALQNADKVYGELDMQAAMDPSALMGMQQMMMAPADSTIDKVLTTKQLADLNMAWAKYGTDQIPLNALYVLKPAGLSTQLAALMSAKVLPDINVGQGIDNELQVRARKAGKQVAGLETMEFQTNMLLGDPISKQAEDLVETIEDIDAEAGKLVRLTNAYLAQNYKDIETICAESVLKNPESAEKMIISRNNNWMKQLAPEIKNTNLLVVVGAGHLVGDKGILNQLKQAGYTVTPVK
jgi:uncharacterized protein YbaP (TraB family)